MTAHTPPTPPAARERKLETVDFEASTTSSLISTVNGVEEEEEDGLDGEGDIMVLNELSKKERECATGVECRFSV